MIETTSFPSGIDSIAAVAGLLGAVVVIYYAFSRNYTYEVRKRPPQFTQTPESTESTES